MHTQANLSAREKKRNKDSSRNEKNICFLSKLSAERVLRAAHAASKCADAIALRMHAECSDGNVAIMLVLPMM